MKTLWALVYFINMLGSEKLSVEQEVKLLSEQETRREFSLSPQHPPVRLKVNLLLVSQLCRLWFITANKLKFPLCVCALARFISRSNFLIKATPIPGGRWKRNTHGPLFLHNIPIFYMTAIKIVSTIRSRLQIIPNTNNRSYIMQNRVHVKLNFM